MKAQIKPDPLEIIAKHGAMTANECAKYLPNMNPFLVNKRLSRGYAQGKLGRRLDENRGFNQSQYIYFDICGKVGNREPEHCVILRTLGKPVEHVDGIY